VVVRIYLLSFSQSAFFNALAVIIVPILDSIFRDKQLGLKGISSVALAILGVGLLLLGPSLLEGTPLAVTPGNGFCLGQAILFGIGYWRLESVSSQHPTQAGRITMGQLLGVALGATIFLGTTADFPTVAQLQGWLTNEFTLGALAWTALVSTALALYLETVALKAVSAAELTVLMTSVSLFRSAFAYVTMGEIMSPVGMMGGLLILAGCIFSSQSTTEVEDTTVEVLWNEWSTESLVPPLEPIEESASPLSNSTVGVF
jgi:drug/metabolite transporter (DMT)-like permease